MQQERQIHAGSHHKREGQEGRSHAEPGRTGTDPGLNWDWARWDERAMGDEEALST